MFVIDRYECFIEDKNKNVSAVNHKKEHSASLKFH